MYDKRTEERAARFGILDRMKALEKDLNAIEDLDCIEFDISDYPEIHHVIIVPRYTIDVRRDDYFKARRVQLRSISEVCEKHDLYPTGDRLEDMGSHWYIVRTCGRSWPRSLPA